MRLSQKRSLHAALAVVVGTVGSGDSPRGSHSTMGRKIGLLAPERRAVCLVRAMLALVNTREGSLSYLIAISVRAPSLFAEGLSVFHYTTVHPAGILYDSCVI